MEPSVQRGDETDLLFRGYSSPVDKKTIELCCWSSQNRRAEPEQFRTEEAAETRLRERERRKDRRLIPLIASGDFLFLRLFLCGGGKQREEFCLQSRLPIFPEASTKSSGSEGEIHAPRTSSRSGVCVLRCVPYSHL